jgi:outer membrane protein assembly factor BamE (lipoprotein component of BamABCDE complex)
MRQIFPFIGLTLAMPLMVGCASPGPGVVDQRNSALTQGNVQLNLRVGETNKAEVLEKFGAPNITTRDASGSEVWSYQRHATVSQSSSSSSFWTILLAGQGSSAAGFSQNMRTMTLIIKFDDRDIVSDFRSRSSDF